MIKKIKKICSKKKARLETLLIAGYIGLQNIVTVSAAAKPNTEEAKNLLNPWVEAGILIIQWAAAVSYTHLDVYKRQQLYDGC